MRPILAALLIACVAASGCVVRELVIKTDPPGATVFINGKNEGTSPLIREFDFYGSREIVLRKDGYLTATGVVTPSVPWYEFFPLDFVFEIIIRYGFKGNFFQIKIFFPQKDIHEESTRYPESVGHIAKGKPATADIDNLTHDN